MTVHVAIFVHAKLASSSLSQAMCQVLFPDLQGLSLLKYASLQTLFSFLQCLLHLLLIGVNLGLQLLKMSCAAL